MSLRPLPDLDNAQVMTKLGRLSALRNARADALHMLRDACVRLQGSNAVDADEITIIKDCIARLEEVEALGKHV